MARLWLHLEPVEDIPPRATADIDLGLDRKGLRLTADSTRVKPLLEAQGYLALPGDEGFRFQKSFGVRETMIVDLLIAKGASRDEPPLLEQGVPTLAAPGLTYALRRGPHPVDVQFVDGDATTALTLPLPTLDAAFVLKGALVQSGVRHRADRRRHDRVDAVMLAAACLRSDVALDALRVTRNKEARRALTWLGELAGHPQSAVALTLDAYLREEHDVLDGANWASEIAAALTSAVRQRPS
jgi:hypothetical protein